MYCSNDHNYNYGRRFRFRNFCCEVPNIVLAGRKGLNLNFRHQAQDSLNQDKDKDIKDVFGYNLGDIITSNISRRKETYNKILVSKGIKNFALVLEKKEACFGMKNIQNVKDGSFYVSNSIIYIFIIQSLDNNIYDNVRSHIRFSIILDSQSNILVDVEAALQADIRDDIMDQDFSYDNGIQDINISKNEDNIRQDFIVQEVLAEVRSQEEGQTV